jgi:hypothetical protein
MNHAATLARGVAGREDRVVRQPVSAEPATRIATPGSGYGRRGCRERGTAVAPRRQPRTTPTGVVLSFLCLLLFGADARPAAATRPSDGLEPLRSLYLLAVSDRAAILQGMREIERLHSYSDVPSGSHREATLTAYEGALITLRAKHAFWPPRKLQHLRQGLAVLDAVVAAHPEHAEARYLRLMSCFYLPSVLGRGESVREDFAALAQLLPDVRNDYPADLYRAIAAFVLDNGALTREDRLALERSLAAADG